MSVVERLLYVIDADSRGGVDANEKFANSAEKAGDKAAMARARVADLERAMASRKGGPTAVQAAQLGILTRKAGEADAAVARLNVTQARGTSVLSSLGNAAGIAGAGMGGAAMGASVGAAAIAAGVAVVDRSIDAYVGLADKVREFQRASGASAEDSSRFVAVLDDLGMDAGKAAGAVFKLGKAINTNPAALRAVGIEIARNADGTADMASTLLNVSDAYAAASSQSEKMAIATAAFGKSGREMIPILEQGRAGLQRYFDSAGENNQIMSDADLAKAREFKEAVDSLGDSIGGIAREIGSVAIGPVSDLVAGLAEIVTYASNAADAVSDFGDRHPQIAKIFKVVAAAAVPFGPLLGMIKRLGANANDAAAEERELADATNRAKEAALAAARATQERADALARATMGAADAMFAEERAALGLEQAHLGVAQAQLALLDLAEQQQQQARGVRDAEEGVASARQQLSDATKDVAEAQAEYNKIVHGYGAASKEALEAQERLTDAQLAARGATLSLQDAYAEVNDRLQAYNEAVAQYGANSKEAKDALRAYERAEHDKQVAEDRSSDATKDAADATKDYNETVRGTGPNSDAARAAAGRLTDAKRAQAAAARGLRNAEEAQSDALKAGARNALQARAATLGLRGAQLSLRDAYLAQARAIAEQERAVAAMGGTIWTDTQYALALGNAIEWITQKVPGLYEALEPLVGPLRVGLYEQDRENAERAHHEEQANRATDMMPSSLSDSASARGSFARSAPQAVTVPITLEVDGSTIAAVVTTHQLRHARHGAARA